MSASREPLPVVSLSAPLRLSITARAVSKASAGLGPGVEEGLMASQTSLAPFLRGPQRRGGGGTVKMGAPGLNIEPKRWFHGVLSIQPARA